MDIRLVVLDKPYAHWDSPDTRRVFNDAVALKRRGYGAAFGSGMLPVDGSDFIGTNLLLYGRVDSEEVPLTGFRFLSLESAREFHLPFPPLTMARAAGARPHTRYIERLIERAEREGTRVAYESSFTMDPRVRSIPGAVQLLKEALRGVGLLHHAHRGVDELLGYGSVRFKTERYFYDWGYRRVVFEGEELGAFEFPYLYPEPQGAVLMSKLGSTVYPSDPLVAPFLDLWEQRIELGPG